MSNDTLLTDSIDQTIDNIAEALRQMRPDMRKKASEAAAMIEKVVMKLRADHPRNPAVALGTVFALYKLAETFRDSEANSAAKGGESPIHLLS